MFRSRFQKPGCQVVRCDSSMAAPHVFIGQVQLCWLKNTLCASLLLIIAVWQYFRIFYVVASYWTTAFCFLDLISDETFGTVNNLSSRQPVLSFAIFTLRKNNFLFFFGMKMLQGPCAPNKESEWINQIYYVEMERPRTSLESDNVCISAKNKAGNRKSATEPFT